jgi:acyl carrier protein
MIFEAIKPIIANQFKIPESAIFEDTNIYNDLKFDSLDAVELIIAIEEHFNLELLDSEADGITTVKDIIDLVAKKMA